MQEAKARLLTSLMVDALAPTNFLPTNPAALKHALETGGASLVKGSRNFADGLLNNHGRWLMGQDPPAFDILAWNADSTRMPFAMHSFYLRNFYLENRLARGELEIAGQQVRLGDVKHPAYIVSAENDHIVPWKSAYASARLLAGPARFVLSSGGHIAGIVNPPSAKGWYLVGDDHPGSADEWRAQAARHDGSWWQDWAAWSAGNSGPLADPPPTGSDDYPVLDQGPGTYICT